MIEKLLDIISLLGHWGYLIIFLAAFLESSAFMGLLVPGESVVVLSGFLASQGYLELGEDRADEDRAAIPGLLAAELRLARFGDRLLVLHGNTAAAVERTVEFPKISGVLLAGDYVGRAIEDLPIGRFDRQPCHLACQQVEGCPIMFVLDGVGRLITVRVGRDVFRKKRAVGRFLVGLPVIFTTATCWAIGELVGYVTGVPPADLRPVDDSDPA